MNVHPALGRIVAGAWAVRDADHWGVRYQEPFQESAHDFLWASIVQVAAAVVVGSRARLDAMVEKEKQAEPLAAVAQVAADVHPAEDRLVQDVKSGVALWQQALRAEAVAWVALEQ
jgi:hypothetical protein